jgi:hypothetical protein
MASYLHNVAARVLAQSVSVQPRLPSLFEPPATSLSARLVPFTNLRPVPDGQEGHEPAVLASTVGPQPEGRMSATLPTAHDNSRRKQGKDQDPPQALHPAEERKTGRDKPAPLVPHGRESDDSILAENPPPRPRPRIAPATFISDEIRSVVPPTNDASARAPADGFPSAVLTRPESRPHADPIAQRASEPSALEFDARPPRASQPPAPLPLTQQPAAVTVPSVSHAVEPGPNVSVVIGRVSVQAVMPQPFAVRPPSPPPAPLLSLEQYLKQRGGAS